MGDGTTVNRNAPVDVVGLSTGVTTLGVGSDHTCALTIAGAVKCWGKNYDGQLGDGTWVSKTIPVDVVGLDSGITDLAVGDNHVCVLTTAGGVKCWGNNSTGQVSDTAAKYQNTPIDVNLLSSGVIGLTAGGTYTCAMTVSGMIKCWGENKYGQLGDGTINITRKTPVDVVGLSSVAAITAGFRHTCALLMSGGVKCWGDNRFGQLGINASLRTTSPVDVVGLNTGVKAVALGGAHSCALIGTGGVKCWGSNGLGELGNGITGMIENIPVDVIGLNDPATSLVAGGQTNCVVMSEGGVKCWGGNRYGQLGDGTTVDKNIPVDASEMPDGVTVVSLGGIFTCILTNVNGVKCWGSNEYGQVGDGTTETRYTPVDVSGLNSSVAAISTGDWHACALTVLGGVKCWGDNRFGQLGNGTFITSSIPVNVAGLESGVTAISTGRIHTCALTRSGTIKCWGYNYTGQLGNGTTSTYNTPVDVVGLNNNITYIDTGGGHTCALTTLGGVKCWGDNTYNQLGDGTLVPKNTPIDVVGLNSGIIALTVGTAHNCVLTTIGGVKCWGHKFEGELGDGSAWRTRPTDVVVESATVDDTATMTPTSVETPSTSQTPTPSMTPSVTTSATPGAVGTSTQTAVPTTSSTPTLMPTSPVALPTVTSNSVTTGAPGSRFVLTGSGFPPNTQLPVFLNPAMEIAAAATSAQIGVVTTDANGAFTFTLATDMSLVQGRYWLEVGVIQRASVTLVVDVNAPLMLPQPMGSVITTNYKLFLPVTTR